MPATWRRRWSRTTVKPLPSGDQRIDGPHEVRTCATKRGWIHFPTRSVAAMASMAFFELRSFFLRPSSYALLAASVLLAAWGFSWLVTLLARGGTAALRQMDDPAVQFFGPNLFLVLLATISIPLLTMNAVADERRRGTWELTLTAPVTATEAICARFLAAMGVWLVLIVPWPFFLFVLRVWGGKTRLLWDLIPWFDGQGLAIDLGPVAGGVVGFALVGGTLLSLGILCSSLCRRPSSAALLSLVVMAIVLATGFLPRVLEHWGFDHEQRRLAEAVSCWGHLESFCRGSLRPRLVVGHLTAIVAVLCVASAVSRRIDNG